MALYLGDWEALFVKDHTGMSCADHLKQSLGPEC